ncbi:ABC transporter ATP-binding protein [Aneurinibacillus sp. Ricciae_BoGa-3]|uniref:ABC transporter ATP-binding protein n=1 Tax=Aneurinibacillus sp. Ricciae_BoGa-3 TaxID=3022697 RepID=UPI00233F7C93|nr:ABC transporter ATP-binding protein [Aneurinibacillus sp. Ricciae_BoGa-3]WCK54920.1 ABC transporter ATP-binding protein [Aneurinibacillus sp. Ricciae_BoGa-3]
MVATGQFNSPMLSLQGLSYAFSDVGSAKPIFSDLSIDVQEGEFVSVIGASGSGKSTLFKLIAGLIEPDQGEIWLGGVRADSRLGKVGYMPQKDLLLPWKTVMDNVLLPLALTKQDKREKTQEIREWLARFGLAEYEQAYPHQLSGGMRQRAAFLRTVVTGRDLLLLDEPFGALDALTKRKMHSWLLELWGDLQKTVVFITHDLEEALLLSDRIYLLSGSGGSGVRESKVSLPRPRSSAFIYKPEFIEMRKELERLIDDES